MATTPVKDLPFERRKLRTHCADGKCNHNFYKAEMCMYCRIFKKLIKEGKTPSVDCPYYSD